MNATTVSYLEQPIIKALTNTDWHQRCQRHKTNAFLHARYYGTKASSYTEAEANAEAYEIIQLVRRTASQLGLRVKAEIKNRAGSYVIVHADVVA